MTDVGGCGGWPSHRQWAGVQRICLACARLCNSRARWHLASRLFTEQTMQKVQRQFVTLVFLALVAVALMVCALYCLEQLERDNDLINGGCVSRTAAPQNENVAVNSMEFAATGAARPRTMGVFTRVIEFRIRHCPLPTFHRFDKFRKGFDSLQDRSQSRRP